MSSEIFNENNYCTENDVNTINKTNGHIYSKADGELSVDIKNCFYDTNNYILKNVSANDQYTSVSNCLRNEVKNNSDKQFKNLPINKPVIGKNSRNNNMSFSDDEPTICSEVGVDTCQQSMIPLIENITTKNGKDPDTLCGLSSTCVSPRLQAFATKKIFLLFFCISLVLQGMYYTYFVSVLTTIEKLFQIRSQTTGIIMSISEAGQIIGGLILPYYGNRGNRPKWIAGGIITFSIGTLLSATPQMYLDNTYLTKDFTINVNSSDVNTANTCSYSSNNKFINVSDGYIPLECLEEQSSGIAILCIFFLSLLAVGIGHTTVQNLGFPYLDDNVNADESPSYFGITIGVRIFGPTLGFILGSFCMRLYINPLESVDFEPRDPRWLGAWWLGIIFISTALFIISIFIAMFPKRLPTDASKSYHIVNKSTDIKLSECHLEDSNRNGNYYCNSKNNSIYAPSKREYTYLNNEKLNSSKPIGEDSCKTISISYIQTSHSKTAHNSSKINLNSSLCYTIIRKISLCLPPKFMRSRKPPQLRTEVSKSKHKKSDFWSTIKRLLKNKVLLLRIGSSVLHLLPIAGLYTFLPKYLETQFDLTVHSAAMISGVGGILVMGIGIAISGYIITKLKPSPTKVASWIALTALLYSIGMFILMFVGCPKENYGRYDDPKYSLNTCNTSCLNCDRNLFSPICASDGNSYFSACYSGCSTITQRNDTNEIMYSNCDCLPPGSIAKLGKCDSKCQNIILYIIVFCIFVFIHSTSEVGAMMITLRCVKPSDKAMALGLISAAVGLFGNVPCPIIYGSVIDHACLVWKNSCDDQGACQLYDTDHFRYYFHGTTGIIMFFAFMVDVFVVRYSKRVKFEDSSSKTTEKSISTP